LEKESTEPACHEKKEHEIALAAAKIKIEAIKNAAKHPKLTLGASLYPDFMKRRFRCIIRKQQIETDESKEANARHHPAFSLTSTIISNEIFRQRCHFIEAAYIHILSDEKDKLFFAPMWGQLRLIRRRKPETDFVGCL